MVQRGDEPVAGATFEMRAVVAAKKKENVRAH
jgi:hypothetical protein